MRTSTPANKPGVSPTIHCDKRRVAFFTRYERLRAQPVSGRRFRPDGKRTSTVTPNHLDRQVDTVSSGTHWFMDIACLIAFKICR